LRSKEVSGCLKRVKDENNYALSIAHYELFITFALAFEK